MDPKSSSRVRRMYQGERHSGHVKTEDHDRVEAQLTNLMMRAKAEKMLGSEFGKHFDDIIQVSFTPMV